MDEPIGKRAADLVADARDESVTVSRLLDTVEDSGHLHDGPLLEHFGEGEQPHYLFHNQVKGVGRDPERNLLPDREGGTVVAVTDRRVLAVVGDGTEGDQVVEVPYEDVTGVEYATGRLKHRLTVAVDDRRRHFWVDRRYPEAKLSAAVEYVREQAGLAT